MFQLLQMSYLLAIVLAGLWISPSHSAEAPRILIVVSGEGTADGKRPGYDFDEFAQAYLIFRGNGAEVEVASPRGGPVTAGKYDNSLEYNARLTADTHAMRLLNTTRATSDLDPKVYDAAFIVGGKGAMFDLPRDTALRNFLTQLWQRGGTVGAVCHGPAALVDVRIDGHPLVQNRVVTGFSNEEEKLLGRRWMKEYPWLLEDALRTRGARFEKAALMLPKLAVDGRLITGQNPYSTAPAAEAVLNSLGIEPVARQPWRDELSMQLAVRVINGERHGAEATLANHTEDYMPKLIGMLGVAHLQIAADDEDIRRSVSLMELAAPYTAIPQLQLALAQGHQKLGNAARAHTLVAQILERTPEMPEAKQLLQQLEESRDAAGQSVSADR